MQGSVRVQLGVSGPGGQGRPWGGQGGVLWGLVEVLRVREPITEGVPPKPLFSPRLCCGLGGVGGGCGRGLWLP